MFLGLESDHKQGLSNVEKAIRMQHISARYYEWAIYNNDPKAKANLRNLAADYAMYSRQLMGIGV